METSNDEVADHSEEDASSDDASSESSEEGGLNQRMLELEASLTENPYHYDSHVELIRLCRISGDLDKTRTARQNMSELFPLSEELWLEWVEDELPLAASSSLTGALQDLRELFERSVEDYMSVPLWLLFAKFALEKLSAFPEGMEFPRDIFEKAIVACGLHISSGGVLWNAYREYEMAVLSSLQELQQSDPADEVLKSQVETQFQRVDKLYKRQLGVALIGMEDTFHGYQQFSDSAVTEESMPAYVRAKKRLLAYIDFENDLAASSPPSLDVYRAYIARAKGNKEDGTFINTLYQRAVSHHCLNVDLWKEYILFLNETFHQVKPVLLHGLKQSIRNCPWMVEFWIGYVRAQERLGVGQEEIVATFEKALVGNLSSAKDYLQLWTAYCDFFRRRVAKENPQEAELVELRRTFKRARDYMEAYYEQSGDPTESLSRYQARLEAHHYGNMEEVRFLWDGIMGRHGKEAQYWMEYSQLERVCGDLENCRKLLYRAVNSASDSPEQVCEALLQFEREEGNVESYEAAMERCASQMTRVLERRERAAEKEAQKKDEKRERKKEKKQRPPPNNQGTNRPPQRKKDPYAHTFYEGGERPRSKEEEIRPAKQPRGEDHEQDDEEGRPVKKKTRVAIADNVESHDVQPAAAMETSGAALSTQPPPPPPSSQHSQATSGPVEEEMEEEGEGGQDASKEQRTVFVSNLRFLITEEQLREKMVECGKVADIRLIKTNRGGKGNVFAYVEFVSTKGVERALKLDRTMLSGRPMFVSPFKEKRSGDSFSSASQKYNDGKSTVYVSNLHHQCTEEELQAAFNECGKIRQVRLVRNKTGRPKGFAYIEYEDEASAALAVQKLDRYDLGGKPIVVAISRPPSKRQEGEDWGPDNTTDSHQRLTEEGRKRDGEFKVPTSIPSSFQYNEEGAVVRKSKTNISLVPRVVARAQEGAEPEELPADKLSNSDFRKLLAKK